MNLPMLRSLIFVLFFYVSGVAQAKIVKGYSLSALLNSNQLDFSEALWLNSSGPLNRSTGVVGARGPLGFLGPFGENWWNVTPWFDSIANWTELSEGLSEINGPLSELGPLYLTTDEGQELTHYDFTLDSAHLLAAGGALMTLGPSGPLGVMGIMGPLGPHGAHGYTRGESGEYINQQGKPVRSIKVKIKNKLKTFSLVEFYKPGKARKVTNLDSSFVAQDRLSRSGVHTYPVKLSSKRWVTITLLSLFDLDTLELSVKDLQGNVLFESNDSSRTNFINLKTSGSTQVLIEVKVGSSFQIFAKPYRLMVIEAPQAATEIK